MCIPNEKHKSVKSGYLNKKNTKNVGETPKKLKNQTLKA